jgi:uncharacterized protein YodC (DUF2158 family)
MPTDKPIELGSVVTLRSGGPLLTVVDVQRVGPAATMLDTFAGNDKLACAWIDANDCYQSAVFPRACLRLNRDHANLAEMSQHTRPA